MRVLYLAVATIAFVLSYPHAVAAHPGRTDNAGGHTCWTNCESWGLSYGEYHYHNGGIIYEEPDYFEQGSEAGAEHVSINVEFITSHATSAGTETGRKHGLDGDLEDNSPDAESVCSEVEFSDRTGPEDYYDGFMDSYKEGCVEEFNNAYSSAYDAAYLAASNERSTEADADTTENTGENRSDFTAALWWAGIIGAFAMIGNRDRILNWFKAL